MRIPYQSPGRIKNSSYYIAPVWDRIHDRPHTVASNMVRFRFRFRLILFCQHTTFSNSNVYKKNEIIKYADTEAPIKTISGRYHKATRKTRALLRLERTMNLLCH